MTIFRKEVENMNKKSIIITVVVALVTAGAGFFGGMQYQKMQRVTLRQFGANGNNQFFQRRFGGQNGGAVVGEILSQDDKSITVKLQDGSSKLVLLSSSTSINKQATGSASDLKTGERVAVFGTTNSDGSVTAQNIQLNPLMRRPTGM